jgi:hypothetical protein
MSVRQVGTTSRNLHRLAAIPAGVEGLPPPTAVEADQRASRIGMTRNPAAPSGDPEDDPAGHERVGRWVAGHGGRLSAAVSAVSDATAIAATAIGATAGGSAASGGPSSGGRACRPTGPPPALDPALRAVLGTIAAGTPASHRLVAAAGRAQALPPLESLPCASFAPPHRRGGRVMLTAPRLPGVALTLPPDFHEVPLDPSLEQRVAAQSRLLDRLPGAAGGRRELVALFLEAMARHLGSVGVVGAAFCAVRIGERASTATLTVGFHETATTDQTLALGGPGAVLRGLVGAVETTAYAGHPALTWSVERPLADGIVIREVQVLVPAPDAPVSALISLATPTQQDWEVYRQVMHDVCTSLRFDPCSPPRAAVRALPLPPGRRSAPDLSARRLVNQHAAGGQGEGGSRGVGWSRGRSGVHHLETGARNLDASRGGVRR